MATRMVSWWGPEPRRVDVARVEFDGDRLAAHGTSTTDDYTLAFRLRAGPAWVTRTLDVHARGDGWARRLALTRDDAGRWGAEWDGDVPAGLALPAADAEGALADALDCDLGLCPLTNTMPILRHGLVRAAHDGDRTPVELVMAWVSVPDLVVRASRQVYTPADPVEDGAGAQVRFASTGFATTLEVDGDGLVASYPGLGYRLFLPA
jgi:hypothetical protein